MAQTAAIFGCLGPRLRNSEKAFFAETQPWGFILFARNLETPDQVKRLTDNLRNAVGRDVPILIDQEGGRVQRLGPPHWRQWLPPLDQMAAAGEVGPRSMELRGTLIAQEHLALGIDVNCTPMADIAEDYTHPVLKNRCYGYDVETVTAAAWAVAVRGDDQRLQPDRCDPADRPRGEERRARGGVREPAPRRGARPAERGDRSGYVLDQGNERLGPGIGQTFGLAHRAAEHLNRLIRSVTFLKQSSQELHSRGVLSGQHTKPF